MLRTAATQAARTLMAVSLLVLAIHAPVQEVQARGPGPSGQETSAVDTAAMVGVQDLPRQGQQTYRLILAGGPFPYAKDGAVFGNYERLLPRQRRGYYREYTVRTPGSRDRGARRIVCGGYRPTQPEACYYTSDHYSSFRKIVP